jgi:hypothetical protein
LTTSLLPHAEHERPRRLLHAGAVSERLRQFALTTQLATGTAEIWSKVEERLAHEPPERSPKAQLHLARDPAAASRAAADEGTERD